MSAIMQRNCSCGWENLQLVETKKKKKVVWISDETLIVLKTLNLHELHKLFSWIIEHA